MKKNLFILILFLVGILIFITGVFLFKGKGAPQSGKLLTPTPEGVLIETPLNERPFVTLTPREDGKELTLDIKGIKNATTVEYELQYFSGDLSRGVIGTVELEGEDNLSRKLLLGTCSRNVCKYDENVSQGTLTLRFRAKVGVRKFTSDFHLQTGKEELSSVDGKFKLTGKLSPTAFYITISTIGLPQALEGEVVSGPYGVFTSGSDSIKSGEISFTAPENNLGKIYAWTGKQWQEIEAFKINQLTTFIATSSK